MLGAGAVDAAGDGLRRRVPRLSAGLWLVQGQRSAGARVQDDWFVNDFLSIFHMDIDISRKILSREIIDLTVKFVRKPQFWKATEILILLN